MFFFHIDKFTVCALAPMLTRLGRKLGTMISRYPDRNHNVIKVTFTLVCLCFAARYCHREKVRFMPFSILLRTYFKLFEADGLHTLFYERLFRVTCPLEVWNRKIYRHYKKEQKLLWHISTQFDRNSPNYAKL